MRNIRTCLFLFLLIAAPALKAAAQDKSAYEKHWLVKNGDSLPYRLLLPKNYDPSKKYPLILVLHGAGERGRDNEAQLTHGWRLFLRDSVRDAFPAIVVFPQCSRQSYWSNVDIRTDSLTKKRTFNFLPGGEPTVAMRLLLSLVDDLQRTYKLNKKQLYVGGLSMGGMGTFELVRRRPKTFAAAFPICGGAAPETAAKIKKVSWWVFHGAKDDVVPPAASEMMVNALKKAGADVRFTLYPTANHNSWDPAFAEPALMTWLFSNRK